MWTQEPIKATADLSGTRCLWRASSVPYCFLPVIGLSYHGPPFAAHKVPTDTAVSGVTHKRTHNRSAAVQVFKTSKRYDE